MHHDDPPHKGDFGFADLDLKGNSKAPSRVEGQPPLIMKVTNSQAGSSRPYGEMGAI